MGRGVGVGAGGDTDDGRSGRNVTSDDGPGTNQRTLADPPPLQHDGARTNVGPRCDHRFTADDRTRRDMRMSADDSVMPDDRT